MSDNSCSADMPCEAPQTLWAEVAGTDLSDVQKLVLERNGEPDQTLEMEQRNLHQRFQCEYAPQRMERREYTLTLTVEREDGSPIRLPLLDEPVPTKRDDKLQPNRLFPVYPMAQLPFADGQRGCATVRPGYLYVFWRGILWRELTVDDKARFQDVDLNEWCEKAHNGTDNPDHRPATGKAVEAIWVPAALTSNTGETEQLEEIEMAWSEVQWSWDYIRAMQSGHDLLNLPSEYRDQTQLPLTRDSEANNRRQARCSDLGCLSHYGHRKRFGPDNMKDREGWGSTDHRWGPIHVFKPSRPRNPGREMLAANPETVIRTISGNGLQNEDATRLHDILRELNAIKDQPCTLGEMTQGLEGILKWADSSDNQTTFVDARDAEEGQACKLDTLRSALEEDDGEPEDLLETIREKAIPAVILQDPLFELGWHATQASLHQHHLSALVESVQQEGHIHSAMLVQRMLFDDRSGRANPRANLRSHVNTNKLDAMLRLEDRKACRSAYYSETKARVDLFKSESTLAVLRDYFTLNDADYLLAFHTLTQLLSGLETDIFRFDPLAGENDKRRERSQASQGSRYLMKVAAENEPLANFITASDEQVPVDATYEPGEVETNDGSGRFRPGLLAKLQSWQSIPDDLPDELQSHRELAEEQHEKFLETLEKDTDLKAWVQASSSQMASLVAEVIGGTHEHFHMALLAVAAREGAKAVETEIRMPTRLLKASNALTRSISLTSEDAARARNMVPLGYDLNGVQSGVGRISEERRAPLTRATQAGANGHVPQMNVVSEKRGQLLTRIQSTASGAPTTPPSGTVTGRVFWVDANNPAAHMASTVAASSLENALRWMPVGMMGVITFNLWESGSSLLAGWTQQKAERNLEYEAMMTYGAFNGIYWLGEFTRAQSIAGQYRLQTLNRTLYDTKRLKSEVLSRMASAILGSNIVTWARVFGAVALGMEIVYLTAKSIGAFRNGDLSAGLGYATAATGIVVATFAKLAKGSAIVLGVSITAAFALATVGWIAAIAGLIWATATDTDLEIWLKQGPLGSESADEKYTYLRDNPRQAYERLFALFFPVQIQQTQTQALVVEDRLSPEEKAFLNEKGWKNSAVVECQSLALLMADNPEDQLRSHFWRYTKRHQGGNWGLGPLKREGKPKTVSPDMVHYDEASGSIRFHFPELKHKPAVSRQVIIAKLQMRLREDLILPANALGEPLTEPKENPEPLKQTPRWATL